MGRHLLIWAQEKSCSLQLFSNRSGFNGREILENIQVILHEGHGNTCVRNSLELTNMKVYKKITYSATGM